MRKVLVTGSTGFLGHHVVKELLKAPQYEVLAIGGRSESNTNPFSNNQRLKFYNLDQLFTESFADVDTVINCAFPRSNDAEQLAGALGFTKKVIARFTDLNVQSVINVSSQGVYKRLPKGELSKEESPIVPVDQYSMVKFAVEKMFLVSAIPYITNVRLASLMMPQRFLYFFVKKAKTGETFTVTAPNQFASLLDVRDAATGLVSLTKLAPEQRVKTYNLGTGFQYSLMEYAESVKNVGNSLGYRVSYDVRDNGTNSCAGMDCSKLKHDTGWFPSIHKDDMIEELFKTISV
jgi:nucleoside-diphosphate-sugar epimerase